MFIIDSDALITSKNGFYAPEFCSHFWELLREAHTNGLIFSIDKVKNELLNVDKPDYLASDFMRLMPDSFWLESEDAMVQYISITSHLADWSKTEESKRIINLERFLDYKAADAWLIAKAMQTKAAILTLEVVAGKGSHKPKIPDVCDHFDVSCVNPFDFLKEYADKNFRLKK